MFPGTVQVKTVKCSEDSGKKKHNLVPHPPIRALASITAGAIRARSDKSGSETNIIPSFSGDSDSEHHKHRSGKHKSRREKHRSSSKETGIKSNRQVQNQLTKGCC